MAVSVLRRYTPPTCTLEITAKQSPLSRWSRQPILRDLRFRLSLDGPHLHTDEHVRIQGDRHQLELLCDVVDAYIQQLLSQSASQFQTNLFQSLPRAIADLPATRLDSPHRSGTLPPTQLEHGRSLVPPDVISGQQLSRPSMPNANAINQTGGQGIVIPSGLALLPCGKLRHELWLGALATRHANESTTLSTIELFDLANALSQYKTDHLVLPDQQQQGRLLRPWMQSAAVLVLAVGATTAFLPTFINQSNQIPTSSEAPIANNEELAEQEDLSALVPSSREDAGLSESFRAQSQAAERARQVPQNEDLLDNSNRRADESSEASGSTSTDRSSPDANAPNPSSPRRNQDEEREIPPELAAIPPIDPRLSRAQDMLRGSSEANTLDNSEPLPSVIQPESSALAESTLSDELPAEAPTSGSLPQVDEIRDYFQRSWQPPEDLERSVEYRLLLNPNGTLADVTPLGQTARLYAGQAGIPAIGAPFVSPLENSNQPQIRLVLQPDGQVRAFLESWN
ncbi:MAG: DUF4335 domain-containing protein [Cyanobacteria bacterium P01_E01_bin.6]